MSTEHACPKCHLYRPDCDCASYPPPRDGYETVKEANAAGVLSGMLLGGDTFGDEDDGPEGGFTTIEGTPKHQYRETGHGPGILICSRCGYFEGQILRFGLTCKERA